MHRSALIASLFLGTACVEHRGELILPAGALPTVAFETQIEIVLDLTNVTDLQLADFTGDGIPDLAALDPAGALQVLSGSGDNGFVSAETYDVALDGSEVRASDIDLDGDIDLVVGSYRQDQLNVLINDGTGTFEPPATLYTTPIPTAMIVQDCNQDGVPDILLTHLTPAFVEVFIGNGDGTFQQSLQLPVPTEGRTAGLSVGDVTGDDIPDVLIADTDRDQVVVLLGAPGGVHPGVQVVSVDSGPFGIATGDLTGDGIDDFTVTNFNSRTVQAVTWNGTAFEVIQTIPIEGLPGFSVGADFTGDGIDDTAVAMIDSRSVTIIEGTGDAAAPLGRSVRIGTTGAPLRPFAGDVNGDGRADLLTAGVGTSSICLLVARDDGLAGGRHHTVGPNSARDAQVVDIDGDGANEVVAAELGAEDLHVLEIDTSLPTRDPAFIVDTTISLADAIQTRSAQAMTIRDLDGDGMPDITVAVDGGVKVCLNKTAGGVKAFDVIPTDDVFVATPEPRLVELVDLSLDGVDDLVVGATDNVIRVATGNGDGTFSPPTETTFADAPTGIAAGDFRGVGQNELAISFQNAAKVQIVRLALDGTLVMVGEILLPQIPSSLTRLDFDGNGRVDLAATNGSGVSSMSLMLASEDGAFDVSEIATGPSPNRVVHADLNDDEQTDLIVTSLAGEFQLLLNDGQGGIESSLRFPGAFTTSSAALADLNGDDRPELVLGGFLTQGFVVFKNLTN